MICKSRIFFLMFILVIHVSLWARESQQPLVQPGVEVLLEDYLHLVREKRVGLITNPTGVDSKMRPTLDLLHEHPDIQLVVLFGPEHGVRGDVTAGEKIGNFIDGKSGLPVYSLYGKTRKPTPEMLDGVDVLVYDIQDIGSRAYTYIYTMALSMEAARENDIPFLVLDRPNPLGGELVEGPVLDPQFSSFIGLYPIPFVYGMTVGELAQLFNREFGIGADLTVIPMRGWKRSMIFEDTGLEWILTSPHIPRARTAHYCAATGIIGELHTIDVGVGYTLPFELVGETWIDASELARELNSQQLPGVYFRALHYRPYYFTRQNTELHGVQVHILDIDHFLPVETQIYLLSTIYKLYPQQLIFETERIGMFNKAMGTDRVATEIKNGKNPQEIIASWERDLEKFKQIRKKYLLYE